MIWITGYSSFPLSSKTNISKFQFDLESEGHRFVSRQDYYVLPLLKKQSPKPSSCNNNIFYSVVVVHFFKRSKESTFFFLDLSHYCFFVQTDELVVAAVLVAPRHQMHSPPTAFSAHVAVADALLLTLFDSGIVFHHYETVLLEHGNQAL